MPLYDILRNHMEELTSHNAPAMTPYVPLLAGSLARSVACIICYPIDLARTRMQVYIDILRSISLVALNCVGADYFLYVHSIIDKFFYSLYYSICLSEVQLSVYVPFN